MCSMDPEIGLGVSKIHRGRSRPMAQANWPAKLQFREAQGPHLIVILTPTEKLSTNRDIQIPLIRCHHHICLPEIVAFEQQWGLTCPSPERKQNNRQN
jgi:hypothetical protein